MKKSILFILLQGLLVSSLIGQVNPAVSSWVINTTGLTGYNCPTCTTPTFGTIPANVQSVYYTATNAYISSQGIPSYNVGPWAMNPNVPSAQNKVWNITLNPTNNTGTKTNTGLGLIGVWSNGIGIFNGMDGYYWNNVTMTVSPGMGTWNRNAYVFEGVSFDACLGHPNVTGTYHNHVIPKCLFAYNNSLVHSPIIGYAFDGFPIYGPYAYTNTNGTGPIKRMTPSYSLSAATTRSLGPSVTTTCMIGGSPNTYYMGTFLEDYIYTPGLGDLDQYNGRFCVTPEYPAGIYAYFVTVDASNNPIFPYVLGPSYYGNVTAGNTGPGGGNNTIPGTATQYTPTATGMEEYSNFPMDIAIFPNPVEDNLLKFELADNSLDMIVKVRDYQGRVLISQAYKAGQYERKVQLPLPYLSAGVYMLSFESSQYKMTKRIVLLGE
jgi:hypothetical protein